MYYHHVLKNYLTLLQIDRIDPLYYANSSRVDVKEETRIKATSDEAAQWAEENKTGE